MKCAIMVGFAFGMIGGAALAQTAPIMCKDPRPEMCTMQFDPVCAQTADGTKKTASNGCAACGDKSIVAYTRGKCEADK
jgi:hypothetical protein